MGPTPTSPPDAGRRAAAPAHAWAGGGLLALLLVAAWAAGAQTAQLEVPSVDPARGRLGPADYPRIAMDPRGGTARLPAPARRIVSLHTNTDEYLYAIVPAELIVGVSESAFDRAFSRLPEMMPPARPAAVGNDVDAILALDPDLVLGTPSSDATVMGRLAEARIPVFRVETLVTRLEEVAENITVIGYLTGQDERARAVRARFETELDRIAADCAGLLPTTRIFGHSMTGFSYGDQTLFHDVIRLIGGTNVAAEGGLHTYERIDAEDVLEWAPDWVFTWSDHGREADELRRWREDPLLAETPAVRAGRIIVQDGRDTRRLSPFITVRARVIADAVCTGP